MRTRAAAKKLAEAAVAVGNAVGTESEQAALDVAQSLAITQALEPMDNSGTATKSTASGTKRKRGAKKQAQPLKGGWVLPHGMGVGVAAPDDSGPKDTVDSSTATSLARAPTNGESDAHEPTPATSKDTIKKTVTRQTRQTRISLRVTKAGLKDQASAEKQKEPVVKVEEPEDTVIQQEDGPSRKRTRTARATEEKTADEKTRDATAFNETTLELTKVKVEEENVLVANSRKLLVIKGITIENNMVAKGLGDITVDATQILDPSFRLMIKRGKENPYGLTPGYSPYPYRRVPTPDACEEVHRILTELHGKVKQPEKMPAASLEVAGCGEVPCVLDALLRTLISGNTLMALADAAIKNLAEHYGLRHDGTGAGSINWDKVRLSSHQELIQVIKVAGNGPKRSQHIKLILDKVYEENTELGKPEHSRLSLDHMHSMTKDEALAKFVSYPGIGIKTAACVTLFCLRMPCFAVDTHVHKFCRWLGWVPEKADPDNCFRHGDFMVPDHLKYGLHQLFIRHGQVCFKCRKATKPGTKDWNEAPDCPLEHLLDRSKDEAASKQNKHKRVVKEETSSEGEDADSDAEVDAGEEEE